MLTSDDVRAAYMLILGRLPEDDKIVRRQIDDGKTFEGLRDILFASDEFVERVKTDASVQNALYPAAAAMVSLRPSARFWSAGAA